ncbi:hypothetical protein GCM10027035_32830 [Emticicia sediminis]
MNLSKTMQVLLKKIKVVDKTMIETRNKIVLLLRSKLKIYHLKKAAIVAIVAITQITIFFSLVIS